jgi:tetratricopeptide (TPR) repeat protein
MKRALLSALLMAALLGLYLWAALYQGIVMISTGVPVAIAMGVALIVLPLAGGWGLWRELSFGFASTRLGKQLEAEGLAEEENLPHRPSGRPIRADADQAFPRYAEEVEQNPDSWRSWFRLGVAYDASGDRKRARAAIRKAIALNKANPA